jgi:predicted AAA+ superfamily ATPase
LPACAPADLAARPRRGASFEGPVIEEIIGLASQRLARPEFFFRRSQAGAAVDLLVVEGRRIIPIEIRAGAAVDHRVLAGLRRCMAGLSLARAYIITTRNERRAAAPGIEIIPWSGLSTSQIGVWFV